MAGMFYVAPLGGAGFPSAAGASFGTFTTFQDVSPTPQPLFLGGSAYVGAMIEFEAEGEFSTTVTPTLQIGFYWGAVGVPFMQSAAITTASGAASFPWHLRGRGTILSTGASGTMQVQGILDLGTSLTANSPNNAPATLAARTVTINTTANAIIGVGAAYSASSASNTVKTNRLTALALN